MTGLNGTTGGIRLLEPAIWYALSAAPPTERRSARTPRSAALLQVG
jgi:hypothetical protein